MKFALRISLINKCDSNDFGLNHVFDIMVPMKLKSLHYQHILENKVKSLLSLIGCPKVQIITKLTSRSEVHIITKQTSDPELQTMTKLTSGFKPVTLNQYYTNFRS